MVGGVLHLCCFSWWYYCLERHMRNFTLAQHLSIFWLGPPGHFTTTSWCIKMQYHLSSKITCWKFEIVWLESHWPWQWMFAMTHQVIRNWSSDLLCGTSKANLTYKFIRIHLLVCLYAKHYTYCTIYVFFEYALNLQLFICIYNSDIDATFYNVCNVVPESFLSEWFVLKILERHMWYTVCLWS